MAVLTKDISASGIRIVTTSSYCFEPGEQYQMEISLPKEDYPILLQARVVRMLSSQGSTEKKEIAFHYMSVSQEDQARITRFVYRREIERQRLGLQ